MKLTKREILAAIFMVAIVIILMWSSYKAGREKGREETIELVNSEADRFTFSIWDEDGWQLGASRGGEFYPDYSGSLCHDYDWDDNKIHLWYEKK